ncbi:MAG: PAS domain S-box protein [Euryarchaeota archaeon]|nr:PAS domain S-box protein [Euryarchaeota archaeon]
MESEESFRGVIEAAGDAIIIADGERRILLWNPAAERIFRYTAQEALGREFTTLIIPEEHRARTLRAFEKARKTGRLVHKPGQVVEAVGLRKDGTTFPLEHSISMVKTARGMRYTAILRDITERKRAEEEIKRLKEFNEVIVQKMEEGIVLTDPEGFITFLNPAMERMLGYSKEELLGKNLSDLVSPGNMKYLKAQIGGLQAEGTYARFECCLLTKEGQELEAIVTSTPMQKGEEFLGTLSVFTRVTEASMEKERALEATLKYKVALGNAYLDKGARMDRAAEAFKDLLRIGYKGMVITREHPEAFREKHDLGAEIPLLWLSPQGLGVPELSPHFPRLITQVTDFLGRKKVLLFDGLDYLTTQRNFEETIAFVQRLNELVYERKGVLLFSIKPELFTPQQVALIERETQPLEPRNIAELSEDLREILEFIYRENREGRRPTHKEISNRFGFSRMTRLKKLKRLKALGLLAESRRGNFKVLEATEKGRELL